MRREAAHRVLLATFVVAIAAGCGVAGRPQGDAACAATARFDGHLYRGLFVQVEPAPGDPLGEAVVPSCDEPGGSDDPSGTTIQAMSIPGVSPDDAFVDQGDKQFVYVRDGLSGAPPEVERLTQAPPCDSNDVPIRLHGPWEGILGADGNTETDLVPPYDLEMFVAEASGSTYLRAHLTIRVPAELGRPISHEDVETALWKEGTLTVSAGCDGDLFVARNVAATPAR